MIDPKALLAFTVDYLKRHPEEVLRAAKNVALLRVGLPIEALRWASTQLRGRRMPTDIEIVPVPPGLRVAATIEPMKTRLRVGATVFIDQVRASSSELRLELSIKEVTVEVLSGHETAIANFIKSGAIDFAKPGNLLGFLPKRPALLLEGKDDRIVVDLFRLPKVSGNPKLARMLSLAATFVAVRSIGTADDHIDVGLNVLPDGVRGAIQAVREQL